jgi:hypothetical protein
MMLELLPPGEAFDISPRVEVTSVEDNFLLLASGSAVSV